MAKLNPIYSIKVESNFEPQTEASLVKKIAEYNIVCLSKERPELYLTDEVLKSAHRLLAIAIFGRTAAQVDLVTAQQMGIPVFTSPYQHQHAVAEFIVATIILLARKLGDSSINIHRGEWQKVSDGCHEVRGKTLGIVGYGHVGSQLGIMAEALSLRVIFYDEMAIMPIGRAEPMHSLEDLLKEADIVSINISHTQENVDLIGKREFDIMKKGAYIINASFGSAIDLVALTTAIESKQLGGAALDVFPPNSYKKDIVSDTLLKLAQQPNVILSPSIADSTLETSERIGKEMSRELIAYIKEGSTMGSVNFPNLVTWPLSKGSRRIVNMHRNVRGVLKEIDNILSAYNVGKQVLDTKDGYGYLIADIATENVTTEIVSELALLANTVRTRIL